MAKKIIILLIFISLVIVGILFALPELQSPKGKNSNSSENINTSPECSTDTDCVVAGCSGQLCVSRARAPSIVTTCEWRDEYACYAKSDCLCQQGSCNWSVNQAFIECLEAK